MPDPSEPQPSVSANIPLQAATSALDLSDAASLPNPPLNLDGIATESTSVQNQGESDLLDRAKQGETEALRQLLNRDLAVHAAELADIEFRGERLQLTISGREVPLQDAVEGLIKEWIVQLGLVQVQKVELYGQREDCELPFWRSEFNPAELELTTPRQKPPEIKPITFAFQKTNVTPASNEAETGVPPLEESVSTVPNDVNSEQTETLQAEALVPKESSWNNVNLALETTDVQPDPTKLAATLANDAQLPSLPLFNEAPANNETVATLPSNPETSPETNVEQAKSGSKQIIENAETAAKRKVVEAFLARYKAGERSFIKIDLSEADLSGINITLADLQEAQLIWANLQEASLYHVNLLGAKLRHANLKGAKLRSANLRGADFLNADLSETDLSWSNLTGANLTGANLTDANLKNAVLDNVIMPDGTRLD
jgi:vacuolar-type H+-ATPase subunit H